MKKTFEAFVDDYELRCDELYAGYPGPCIYGLRDYFDVEEGPCSLVISGEDLGPESYEAELQRESMLYLVVYGTPEHSFYMVSTGALTSIFGSSEAPTRFWIRIDQ